MPDTERADQSENEKRCEKENEHTDLRSKFSSNQLSKSSRTQNSGSGVTQAKTVSESVTDNCYTNWTPILLPNDLDLELGRQGNR
jgi:hypothetical protein